MDETKENENPDENEPKDESDPDKKDKSMNDKNKSKDKKKDTKDKDRWHGKSREEIIKEYESLEKNEKPDEGEGDDDKENQDENEELNLPSAEELQKMTPSDFAKWVLTRIDKGVKRTIEVQENKSKFETCQKDKLPLQPTPQVIFSLTIQYLGNLLRSKGGDQYEQ